MERSTTRSTGTAGASQLDLEIAILTLKPTIRESYLEVHEQWFKGVMHMIITACFNQLESYIWPSYVYFEVPRNLPVEPLTRAWRL